MVKSLKKNLPVIKKFIFADSYSPERFIYILNSRVRSNGGKLLPSLVGKKGPRLQRSMMDAESGDVCQPLWNTQKRAGLKNKQKEGGRFYKSCISKKKQRSKFTNY